MSNFACGEISLRLSHQESGGGEGGHSCEAGQVHGVGGIGRGGRVDGDVGVVGI